MAKVEGGKRARGGTSRRGKREVALKVDRGGMVLVGLLGGEAKPNRARAKTQAVVWKKKTWFVKSECATCTDNRSNVTVMQCRTQMNETGRWTEAPGGTEIVGGGKNLATRPDRIAYGKVPERGLPRKEGRRER